MVGCILHLLLCNNKDRDKEIIQPSFFLIVLIIEQRPILINVYFILLIGLVFEQIWLAFPVYLFMSLDGCVNNIHLLRFVN